MKVTNAKTTLLRSFPGYAELGDRELTRLASLFDEIRVDAGTVLARQGQPSHELCLIADGEAVLSVRGEPIAVLGPGDVLGEPAILKPGPHRATATARTPMRILVAGRRSRDTLRSQPVVLRQIATNLADRLRPSTYAGSSTADAACQTAS